jgi:hypothetical protein
MAEDLGDLLWAERTRAYSPFCVQEGEFAQLVSLFFRDLLFAVVDQRR